MTCIAVCDLFFEICNILTLAGSIGDEVERFRTKACYDGVVDYTSSTRV